MPLIKEFVSGDANIVLWKRSETAEELLSKIALTEAESKYYSRLNTEKRKCEWLAWHLLVKDFFNDHSIEIIYNSEGAPVANTNREISVSHGGELVGIAVAPTACGIDIEPLNRDFSRVRSRILNEQESRLLEAFAPIAPAAAIGWCVKECAFKIAHTEGVDFLNDVIITAANTETNSVVVDFKRIGKMRISIEIVDNHIICYGTNEENI